MSPSSGSHDAGALLRRGRQRLLRRRPPHQSVAGRILWTLLRQHVADGRPDFSNKELRLDPPLDMSGFKHNLESRPQYSPLITKNEPRMVPASFDLCLANLNREASSAGTSMPSDSLNPTARFLGSSVSYITLMESPLS